VFDIGLVQNLIKEHDFKHNIQLASLTAEDCNNSDIWLMMNAKIYSEERADESVSLETRHHGAVLPTYCVLLCSVVLCPLVLLL
jgi:hypothetical protein